MLSYTSSAKACGHISPTNRYIVLSARPTSYCQRPGLHRLSIQQDGRLVPSEACRCAGPRYRFPNSLPSSGRTSSHIGTARACSRAVADAEVLQLL